MQVAVHPCIMLDAVSGIISYTYSYVPCRYSVHHVNSVSALTEMAKQRSPIVRNKAGQYLIDKSRNWPRTNVSFLSVRMTDRFCISWPPIDRQAWQPYAEPQVLGSL